MSKGTSFAKCSRRKPIRKNNSRDAQASGLKRSKRRDVCLSSHPRARAGSRPSAFIQRSRNLMHAGLTVEIEKPVGFRNPVPVSIRNEKIELLS